MNRKSDLVRKVNTLKVENEQLRARINDLLNENNKLVWKSREAEENADLARKLMLSAANGFAFTGRFAGVDIHISDYHGEATATMRLTRIEGVHAGVAINPGQRVGFFVVDETK